MHVKNDAKITKDISLFFTENRCTKFVPLENRLETLAFQQLHPLLLTLNYVPQNAALSSLEIWVE